MNKILQNILGRKDKPMRLIGTNPNRILNKFRSKRFNNPNDWDSDGVPNRRDCQPRNPMRQDTSNFGQVDNSRNMALEGGPDPRTQGPSNLTPRVMSQRMFDMPNDADNPSSPPQFVQKIQQYTKTPINYDLGLTVPLKKSENRIKDIYGIKEDPDKAMLTKNFRGKI